MENKKSKIESVKVTISAIALFVACFAFWDTHRQIDMSEKQYLSSDSTGHYRDSVYVRSVKYDNRPWVQMKMVDPWANVQNGHFIQLRVGAINTGITPAKLLAMYCTCTTDTIIDTANFKTDNGTGLLPSKDASTEPIPIISNDVYISVNDFFSVRGKSIFFFGNIIYEDVFKEKHFTHFYFRVIPNQDFTKSPVMHSDKVRFTRMPIYNDFD